MTLPLTRSRYQAGSLTTEDRKNGPSVYVFRWREAIAGRNSIASVRQVRRRTIEPSILEPVEIAAILRELEGVEPVRTAFLIAVVMGIRR